MAKKTRNFGDVIRRRLADDPELRAGVESEAFNIDVAALIFSARKIANLTQAQLAKRVGTTQSVIARIEDADYDGHSHEMLTKSAAALYCRLQIDDV